MIRIYRYLRIYFIGTTNIFAMIANGKEVISGDCNPIRLVLF